MESLGFIAKSLAKLITLLSSVPSNRSVTLRPSFFISLSLSLSPGVQRQKSSPCSSSISPACLSWSRSFMIITPSSMGLLFTNKAAGLLHGFVASAILQREHARTRRKREIARHVWLSRSLGTVMLFRARWISETKRYSVFLIRRSKNAECFNAPAFCAMVNRWKLTRGTWITNTYIFENHCYLSLNFIIRF